MNHFYSHNQQVQCTLSTNAVVGFPFNVIQHVIDINHFADSNKTKTKTTVQETTQTDANEIRT